MTEASADFNLLLRHARPVNMSSRRATDLTAVASIMVCISESEVLHIDTARESGVEIAANVPRFLLIFCLTAAVVADPGLVFAFSRLEDAHGSTTVKSTRRFSLARCSWPRKILLRRTGDVNAE